MSNLRTKAFAAMPGPQCQQHALLRRTRGFTLTELVLVLVMLGVLAAYAAPKLFVSSDFYARGFHDETMAYLRFAQKVAIAQRRTVCVSFGGTTALTLTIAANAATTNCSVAGSLQGPAGNNPATLTAKSPANYVAPPTAFNFNGLGQPITTAGVFAATQTLQVVGTGRNITIEAATGYVHE